jgi:hypothetical protein
MPRIIIISCILYGVGLSLPASPLPYPASKWGDRQKAIDTKDQLRDPVPLFRAALEFYMKNQPGI